MLVAGLWFASPTIVKHSMNGLETGLYFLASLATLNLFAKFIEDDFLRGARLDPRTDGRPDPRPFIAEEAPGLGDLRADFDFRQAPRPPVLLPLRPPPGPASLPGT
jgi:hypothetical protein